jgi:hypothetical protein
VKTWDLTENGDFMEYPLVICYIAVENGHRNTVVELPIENGDFP